jgi:glyoxylase-like metal-dependent hydrolase (beta-lactamase superfamily II)
MTLTSGQLDEIAPDVRRLIANNAGPLTGAGTNTYLLGRLRYLVIDPGPADPQHLHRILQITEGAIEAIMVTHTHGDHSPGAARLAEQTGAQLLGRAPPAGAQDAAFEPTRVLNDGDLIRVDAIALRALHTPGHASNHVCYLMDREQLLFSGDHLIQGSTVVIAPPDGHMASYLRSLHRLQAEPIERIAPGHGSVIEPAQQEIARIIAHRLQREGKVQRCLRAARSATLDELVTLVYDDVDARMHTLAKASLLAHLIKLEEEGRAACSDEHWRTM